MPVAKGTIPMPRQVTATTRCCRTCHTIKNVSEFYGFVKRDRPNRPDKKYYFSDCKLCSKERHRMDTYGVTLAEMIEKQGTDFCPLCLTRKAACLDHDHVTGKPRGGLCQPCNRALHYIENDEWRERAEAYVAG